MDLKSLKTKPVSPKRRKIVGRGPGSGHGRNCGRGGKGSKARSGYFWKAHFEGGQMPLFRRMPKKGFRNGPFRKEYAVVNLADLAGLPAGSRVDAEFLQKAGRVRNVGDGLRVLGTGEIDVPLTVSAAHVSETAAAKIRAAGGTVEILRKAVFRRKK
jgi:large subunit ribosomal protein L15